MKSNQVSEIIKRITDIRSFIDIPRRQYQIMENPVAWNQLRSCLYAISDAELALSAFDNIQDSENIGERLIIVYGILQILFVQQDAIQHLADSLKIKFSSDPLLKKIREVRNFSIGHPTRIERQKKISHSFIVQHTMHKDGFKLATVSSDNHSWVFSYVETPKLIESQRTVIKDLLDQVINKLKAEEMEHKEKFKDSKLIHVFPQNLLYYYEKIAEEIVTQSSIGFGEASINALENFLNEFKASLDERDLLKGNEFLKHRLEDLTYATEQLKQHFRDKNKSRLNEQDAHIFLFFIKENIEKLQQDAKEIDEDYDAEP